MICPKCDKPVFTLTSLADCTSEETKELDGLMCPHCLECVDTDDWIAPGDALLSDISEE